MMQDFRHSGVYVSRNNTKAQTTMRENKPRAIFNLIREVECVEDVENLVNTKHFHNDRQRRLDLIERFCGGLGTGVYSFLVDEGHKDGLTIQTITDNGIVVIQNATNKRLVTAFVPSIGHIERYFPNHIFPLDFLAIVRLVRVWVSRGYDQW